MKGSLCSWLACDTMNNCSAQFIPIVHVLHWCGICKTEAWAQSMQNQVLGAYHIFSRSRGYKEWPLNPTRATCCFLLKQWSFSYAKRCFPHSSMTLHTRVCLAEWSSRTRKPVMSIVSYEAQHLKTSNYHVQEAHDWRGTEGKFEETCKGLQGRWRLSKGLL